MRAERMAAGAVTLSLLAGCAAGTDSNSGPPVLPAEMIKQIRTEFSADIAFWQQRAIGGIAATRLIVLSGPASYTCPPNYELKANDPSQFCPKSQTVIMTAKDRKQKDSWRQFVVAHEVGHSVQHQRKEDYGLTPNQDFTRAKEQGADCYAGVTLQARHPDIVAAVSKALSRSTPDDAHGSSAGQQEAFDYGVHNSACPTIRQIRDDPFPR